MYILNRTKIIGRENLVKHRNILIIANHLTMIDSWFITTACCWPQMILKPWLIPWHLPEEKNFLKNWVLRMMCSLWKCIPIRRGTGNFLRKLDELTAKLQVGSIMIFPEGTRSREPKSGQLYDWNMGAVILAQKTKATVLPVAHRGTEDVLPIGRFWPRIGKKMVIVIGRPLDVTIFHRSRKEELLQSISSVMEKSLQNALTKATTIFENQ